MKNNLPEVISFLSKKFNIKYFENVSDVDQYKEDSLFGQVNFRTNTIRIYKPEDSNTVNVLHTIFHEVIHIIKENLSIDFVNDEEERIIDNLAIGIVHLLVENKFNFENITEEDIDLLL